MATDSSAPVNGIYKGQYDSPAELAAPSPGATPSQSTSSTAASARPETQPAKADPQEIGWYFVEQYYTTLSKNPDRTYLFYGKKSQFVTGVEAEKVVPAVGVKDIGEKIKELDIQDCKVRVLNVDSQSSDKSIVVQVIGEMSNKSEPHHKFVQTFVLAEQTNGYYVLNDIFRYLNDDEDEIIEDEPAQLEPTTQVSEPPIAEPLIPEESTKAPEEVDDDDAVEKVDAKLEEHAKVEAEKEEKGGEEEQAAVPDAPEVNGVSEQPSIEEPAAADEVPVEAKEIAEEAPAAAFVSENPPEPEHTPVHSPPKDTTPAPAADAPPAKKTWANLVGSKAPAVPALPASGAPVPSQPKAQKVSQTAAAPTAPPDAPGSSSSQGNGWQTADHGKKQNRPQAKGATEQITLAYIKNVNDKVDARVLKEVLERYGELKYFDVSRPRNCAFVEFADPAGYNAAVAANPHPVGTEQIFVEERRPRPGAFGGGSPQFARGNNPNAGRGRGGMQGRTASQGGFAKEPGRGNFQQRGGKSGNITPKGRGQA